MILLILLRIATFQLKQNFQPNLLALPRAPSPGCSQCLLRHSTRGPSLWFVTYRNKWPEIVSENPVAFRTLFSWKITQPPEAHEPWEASAAADPSRKKVSQAAEEEERLQETFTSSKAEAAKSSSLCPGICLCPSSHPTLALEGESVPKIFGDWEGTVLKVLPPRGDDLCPWNTETLRRLLLINQSLECASPGDTQTRCLNPALEFSRSKWKRRQNTNKSSRQASYFLHEEQTVLFWGHLKPPPARASALSPIIQVTHKTSCVAKHNTLISLTDPHAVLSVAVFVLAVSLSNHKDALLKGKWRNFHGHYWKVEMKSQICTLRCHCYRTSSAAKWKKYTGNAEVLSVKGAFSEENTAK